MNESTEQNLVAIPESKAARWAWRVSMIPVLGLPLFIALAFISLYTIGKKGQMGFWLLRRGVIAVFIISIIPYFGLYFAGYSGYNEIISKAYWFLPKHGTYQTFYSDGNKRELSIWYFGKGVSYTAWYETGIKAGEGKSISDSKGYVFSSWQRDGQKSMQGIYRNGKKNGQFIYWDVKGNIETEIFYSNDKPLKTIKYKNGKPITTDPAEK